MLKSKSLALTPPGHRGSSWAQGGIRNNTSFPARQNKGQVLNTSQSGEKNSSRWELHGIKPTWKSTKTLWDLVRERRWCAQSLLCIKYWRVSVLDLWLPWRRSWRGMRSLCSSLCNSFGWCPLCYVSCSRSGLFRETKDLVYPPWPACWVS